MWYHDGTLYQIFPLGLCAAPRENEGMLERRLSQIECWIPHIQTLANAVTLSPVFESDRHGYDTWDYFRVDARLGSNDDLKALVAAFHRAGIRVVLDGVFNHVGRGFWAFRDLLEKRQDSPYRDWFFVDFNGQNSYHDGLWYEGWEGHDELVKLNLHNPDVVRHLLDAVRFWIETFDIDGLRLDVAYMLDPGFQKALRRHCDALKPHFFLYGEILHGDYKRIVNDDMLHSCTNYECYKGIYSSFNDLNFFEIAYSLNRQFGQESWTLYRGEHLVCFLDNHDVTRIASILQNDAHLPLAYTLLFVMPGIPCVYYGSEWGILGEKSQGDDVLRPAIEHPAPNALTDFIRKLVEIRRAHPCLAHGSFANLHVTNQQYMFERDDTNERILCCFNAANEAHTTQLNRSGQAIDLLTGLSFDLAAPITLPACSAMLLAPLA